MACNVWSLLPTFWRPHFEQGAHDSIKVLLSELAQAVIDSDTATVKELCRDQRFQGPLVIITSAEGLGFEPLEFVLLIGLLYQKLKAVQAVGECELVLSSSSLCASVLGSMGRVAKEYVLRLSLRVIRNPKDTAMARFVSMWTYNNVHNLDFNPFVEHNFRVNLSTFLNAGLLHTAVALVDLFGESHTLLSTITDAVWDTLMTDAEFNAFLDMLPDAPFNLTPSQARATYDYVSEFDESFADVIARRLGIVTATSLDEE
jgi:hypothetical protein